VLILIRGGEEKTEKGINEKGEKHTQEKESIAVIHFPN